MGISALVSFPPPLTEIERSSDDEVERQDSVRITRLRRPAGIEPKRRAGFHPHRHDPTYSRPKIPGILYLSV